MSSVHKEVRRREIYDIW